METLLYMLAFLLVLVGAFGVNLPRVSLAWLGMAVFVFTVGVLPALSQHE